jgi:hypothetical protein
LSAADRLTRDDIFTALPLCINVLRIATTLVLPDAERFGRDDINASLSVRPVLALATLDEISRVQPDGHCHIEPDRTTWRELQVCLTASGCPTELGRRE